ncbi:hypothetical protein F5144DRAFT_659551 [Chaetomium tenue]|uniref:Uncharacterized protein n=1 Tax=Chaetomium tenue TaxID=1854479 RepID=A0ACB7NWU9_9PEZI|nr:hypothetical protein F5144DRAFT_659551 [Chaetomium globosum]
MSSLAVLPDINLMIIPETSTKDPAMTLCCEPNPVQTIDRYWLWCEFPASYWVNGTKSNNTVQQASETYLRTNGRSFTESRIAGGQFNAVGQVGAGSVRAVGVWMLALSGLVYVL